MGCRKDGRQATVAWNPQYSKHQTAGAREFRTKTSNAKISLALFFPHNASLKKQTKF